MTYRFVVLKTPWWECIAAGVPFLSSPGDSFTVIEPTEYLGPNWDDLMKGGRDVIMNPHRAPMLARVYQQYPDSVILYEAENLLYKGGVWAAASEHIRRHAPRCEWWNYSAENSKVYGDTPRPLRIPLGQRRPAQTDRKPDLDVVFVGSLNERRSKILSKLEATGVRVAHTTGPLFGADLAGLEARARVVLNAHFYEPGIFESFRVVPAAARGSVVVSEASLGGEGEEFCAKTAPYSELVDAVIWEVSKQKVIGV
jgi:hypothetical protein